MLNITLVSTPIPLFNSPDRRPLAERLRPTSWDEIFGLDSVETSLLQKLKSGSGIPPSLILWGPPGAGKTTFGRLLKKSFSQCRFVELSAVLSGVKEVKEVCEHAKHTPTILFVDEIHRFNKAQQDAFLPFIERGDISLIGATTENPSFYLTQALLSRTKVIQFSSLSIDALLNVIKRAETETATSIDPKGRILLAEAAQGDARKLLNLFESIISSPTASGIQSFSYDQIKNFLQDATVLFYDRGGEEHYNTVSAFIKSLRGSDPDAALFWGFKMIESGDDPRFVIRRMMIFASEDIGNADPRALSIAIATAESFDRLGLPEGKIPIAQCITYLATAPKSNRSYVAMGKAIEAVKKNPKLEIPLHLRNAPTKLMKDLNYGAEYQYPHDDPSGHIKGVKYLPDKVTEKFYEPSTHGYEKNISELIKQRQK